MKKRDSRFWSAPVLWPDGECFIIGGGPSLREVDISCLREKRTIAVNMAYRLGNWMDALFFGDMRWWNANGSHLTKFAGLKITTQQAHFDKPGVKVIRRANSRDKRISIVGLSSDPSVVTWNLSSGACAINLAVHFGVKRIVLLGFDMKADDKQHHWHDYYASKKLPVKRDPYPRFMKPFPDIAHALKERGVECINACPDSALTVFPRVTLESVLC